ncbi:heterogeneous nuclear ribonucleoprotein L-like isoform X2 [Hetaerina americana]|uniref:heterogeneous nuclear ribonucleoprotein L-like isoform X2 n=1 Tax=Hetaerina americana TaxID=62018 RepID=UPI003A7F28DC
MAYNGEGPMMKRPKTDVESPLHKNHSDQYGGYQDEPRRKRTDNDKVNHVLLFTILNPVYPITVEVLHTICSPNGQVLRIVIFKKNGVQAMVEFDSVESAKRAKDSLHGADIYSGCCTLKIEYAKPSKLNVYKNDAESWDYSNPNLGKPESMSGRPAPLLQEPRYGAGPQPYRSEGGLRGGGGGQALPPQLAYAPGPDRYEDGGGYGHQGRPGGGAPAYADHYPSDRYVDRCDIDIGSGMRYGSVKGEYVRQPLRPSPPRPGYAPGGGGGGGLSGGGGVVGVVGGGGPSNNLPQQGSVMMVYGLNLEKVNPEKLFNVFCLYGNVVRIKFLKTKEGCAMIQMGDSLAVERAVQNLNNISFFDCKLQLGYSKQAFLSDVQHPYPLPDGSPSFKDFMGNKNNRFINPAMASKNRIQPPSKILHFFNTPPNLTEERLKEVFDDLGVSPPKTIKLFPSKTERSSSGLMEFDNISQSLEALMICNHAPIQNPNGKFPYIMKLCFSSSRQIPNSLQMQKMHHHKDDEEDNVNDEAQD